MGGHKAKEVGQDGEGQEARDKVSLTPKIKKADLPLTRSCAKDGRGHLLDYSGSPTGTSENQGSGLEVRGLEFETPSCHSLPGSHPSKCQLSAL